MEGSVRSRQCPLAERPPKTPSLLEVVSDLRGQGPRSSAAQSFTKRCGSHRGQAVHWNTFVLPKCMKAWTGPVKGNEAELG